MAIFGEILSNEIVQDLDKQTPVDAATINLTIVAGHNTFVKFSATQDSTINISSGTPEYGDELTCIISNDATPRTHTFGTKFKTTGTLTGTANKISTITFVSDGTDYLEVARTTGL